MNERVQLLPGVCLRVVNADKFKTACFSINFLQPLTRQIAPLNALLPSVLLRGTRRHPGIREISQHLDALYGASFGTLVRKKGDVITCGFYSDFIEDRFTPDGTRVFAAMVDFLREILFEPCLDAQGLFLEQFVEGEKQNLVNAIEAGINDKRSYAANQMLAAMCASDPYGVPRLGDVETCRAVTARRLSAYYQEVLTTAPVEIFYMGRTDAHTVASYMRNALQGLGRRSVLPVSYLPISGKTEVQYLEECMDITQGKLCMGLRTNCTGADPREFARLQMLNAIFGNGINSKLFLHVLEELSLCYYAASSIERFKGIMLISSGIDAAQYETARDEILGQLEACRQGQITWEELEAARRFLVSAYQSSLDAPGRIDDFYLGQTLCDDETTIEDRIQMLQEVTLQDVIQAAKRIELDTVYFLKGAAQ